MTTSCCRLLRPTPADRRVTIGYLPTFVSQLFLPKHNENILRASLSTTPISICLRLFWLLAATLFSTCTYEYILAG